MPRFELSASTGHSPEETINDVLEYDSAALLAYLRQLTGSWHSAEEVLQATLVKAYLALKDGAKVDAPRSWLFSIARREMIDHQRRSGVLSRIIARFQKDLPKHESEKPSGELKERLYREMDRLPPSGKEALILKYFHGLTYQEVAEVLGVHIGTVKQLVFRAIDALRHRMEKHLWEAQNGEL